MATITFNQIPFSDPDLVSPGRGAEQWHDRIDVNIPNEGTSTIPRDVYWRTTWNRFETGKDQYTWSWLDDKINQAKARKQKLSFGIMTVYTDVDPNTGGVNYDGGTSAYPLYLHQLMQAENPKDWKVQNSWIPNWNSPSYHARLLALNQAVNKHIIDTGNLNMIGEIDIRGYGNWGEWHSAFYDGFTTSMYPAGTFPSAASLIKIVDTFRLGFPDIQLQAMISGFDAIWLNNTNNPAEIANYLLTAKNNVGFFGWRRDNWGALDGYIKDYLENNNRSFGASGPFKVPIMDRWKFAPITGEPPGWNPSDYSDLERQTRLYHATSWGNGNYGGGQPPSATGKTRVRASSKACGYRLVVESAEITTSQKTLIMKLNWHNVGIAPTYEKWDIVFELINQAGTVIPIGKSSHQLRLFLPTPTAVTITDTIQANVSDGNYTLRFSVKDPGGYRDPMPLAIVGNPSGNPSGYSLGAVTLTGTTPPANQGPIANAGPDKEITLPLNSVIMGGSGTDPDGTIVKFLWEKVSGNGSIVTPNSATTTVNNLGEGTTVLRLTVTDNVGATNSDQASIKVNPANPAPVPCKKVIDVSNEVKTTVIYDDGTTEIFT